MTGADSDVVVIGAGVSGLTTAITLAEAGFRVRVWADRQRGATTSYAAGAIWGPFLAAHERADRWSAESRVVFERLAKVTGSGVRLVFGVDAARVPADEPPGWARAVHDFRPLAPDDLPPGFVSGWSYTVPIIDMPVYLEHLTGRLAAAGVRVEPVRVRSLDQAASDAPVLVNCTGMGARSLVPDPDVVPVRGQLMVVDNPGVDAFFADHTEDVDDLTYLLPQGDHLVLGGSAEPGRVDLPPDPGIGAAILARCVEVEPRLRDVRIREHRVGLRPSRPHIRVECERTDRYLVVHNYGHGGSGVSLSWGCATEVLDIVERLCR